MCVFYIIKVNNCNKLFSKICVEKPSKLYRSKLHYVEVKKEQNSTKKQKNPKSSLFNKIANKEARNQEKKSCKILEMQAAFNKVFLRCFKSKKV